MAMGAIFAAMLDLLTAVMQTVQTKRKVPIASIKKAEPRGKSGVTVLAPNRNGGAVIFSSDTKRGKTE